MIRASVWLVLLTACAPTLEGPVELGEGTLREDTPEALAVLRMLADPVVTVDVLDVDAGLDARAARGLIARRDGPDARLGTPDDAPFQSIAQVDAVPHVGPAALRALAAFAVDGGWLEPGPVVIEGVPFTAEQAERALGLANGAALAVLDDEVGLDSRAAAGLVEGRPFADLSEVGAVPYVGTSALIALRDHVPASDGIDAEAAITALALLTPGLWFTSETDARLTVIHVPGGAGVHLHSAGAVLAQVSDPDQAPLAGLLVEQPTLARTFDRYTVAQEWWEPSQHDEQPTWQAIRDVFELELTDAKVFRFGEPNWDGTTVSGAIQVFIVGTTSDGDLVGLRTFVVET